MTYRPRLVDPLLDAYTAQLPAVMVDGARATGKTTTVVARATTVVRLDVPAEAAAFIADPDAALRGLAEPVLLDEWQEAPDVLGAVRRAVDAQPTPNRFLLTGSARATLNAKVWPATGRIARVAMHPMTVREQLENTAGPSFLDTLANGSELSVATDAPDLQGYVELALRGGYPAAALRLSGQSHRAWHTSYLDNLLTHDVAALRPTTTRPRDAARLRRYFEAYALNSAGLATHKTIYDAAGIERPTADAYEQLLSDLFIVEPLPAWETNRLKRLVRNPKRCVVEPALIAAALRLDVRGVLSDGDLLGRVLESFVVAQLRAEAATVREATRLFHLRTAGGREEVDVVAELGGGRVIGVEVKATATPRARDGRHLAWLRERLGERFVAGVLLHTGPRIFELDDRIVAAPICCLWA